MAWRLPEQGARPVAAHTEKHIAGDSLNIHLHQQLSGGITQQKECVPVAATQLQMTQQVPTGHETFEPVLPVATVAPWGGRVRLQPRDISLQ